MRILLTVMVKNEQRALPRLLRSAKGVVDGVVVTDTGSTDDTVAVAKAVCQELGLPLDLFVDVWSDFGTNRSRNIAHAQNVAGGNPDTYLLLMDADMEIPGGVPRPPSLPEVGMLPQCDGRGTWRNIRVVRADVQARYVRRTHEYLDHNRAVTPLHWFTITDHCDGGSRGDKFERDERLLRLDLAERNDGRSRFYLAQTLQNMGRKREAIELYDQRAKMTDFPEEAWMAMFEASRCCDGPEADMRALNAFYTRRHRAEPLADVARRASDRGDHKLALALSDIGSHISFPTTDSLYCDAGAYRWTFPYVDMVSSFYAGDLGRGMKACDYLHLTRGSPYWWMALENASFYAQALPGERRPLAFTPPAGFVPMNPSLHPRDRGGWIGLIRCVNYRIDDCGRYLTADGAFFTMETPIITRNFLQNYGDDMVPQGDAVELQTPPSPVAGARIRGFEDLRFVSTGVYSGDIVTAGVRLDANARGIPEYWEATWGRSTGELRSCRRLSQEGKVEKNWLPVADEEGHGYLYGYDPITRVDADGAVVHQAATDLNLSAFRGSAAPIRHGSGALFVIHEVIQPGGGKRVYLHRFVWSKGDDFWVSPPFLMKGRPCIECCFSINKVAAGVMLTCSWEDREVYTITVPNNYFSGLMQAWTHGRSRALPKPEKPVS
jgi:hypothetical protein